MPDLGSQASIPRACHQQALRELTRAVSPSTSAFLERALADLAKNPPPEVEAPTRPSGREVLARIVQAISNELDLPPSKARRALRIVLLDPHGGGVSKTDTGAWLAEDDALSKG